MLWFSGLVISLMTASGGIFSKQWLREYMVNENAPEAHLQIRFFRAKGVKKWYLFELITILPLLLQLSMFLFFLGLIEFLNPLNGEVKSTVTALIGIWGAFVIVVTLMPLIDPKCPWRTPILHHAFLRCRADAFRHLKAFFEAFDEWRKRRYKLSLSIPTCLGEQLRALARLLGAVRRLSLSRMRLSLVIAYLFPPRPPPRPLAALELIPPVEEEDIRKGARFKNTRVLINSYELVTNDGCLQSILGSLMSQEFELGDVIQCLRDIHHIRRQSCWENEVQIAARWEFGDPILYSNSLLQDMLPLLMNKLRVRASWFGLPDRDVKAAIRFILFDGNEAIVGGRTIWPLMGDLMQDQAFTRVMIQTLIEHWDPFRAIPQYPQFENKSRAKGMLSHDRH